MKVVIIGGIAAGMSAAAKLRRTDPQASIKIIEKQNYISFGACGLPYYIGGQFDESERMLVRTPQQVETLGIELMLQHEAVSVDAESKTVQIKSLASGEIITESYDRLMIASGARAANLTIENADLKNVYHVRTLEDGEKLKALLKVPQIQRIGVIGAGFIGLEIVDAIRHLGKEAVVFHNSERILNNVFDSEITNLLEEELVSDGVALMLNRKVIALKGTDTVQAVITDQESIDVDAVIIAAGVRPNTEFVQMTGIKCLPNGAIIIDDEGRTSIPDIYAAGDCATVMHQLKKEPAYLPLATTANKLGRLVGSNLAGNHERFEGTLGSACIKVLSMEAGRTGLTETEAYAQGYQVQTVCITDKNHTDYYPGQEELTIKLIYEANSKVILGGQAAGRSDAVGRINVIAVAIAARMTTKQLGMMDFCYAPPFARTWDALNIAGNAAK